jgi:hypothetical protein
LQKISEEVKRVQERQKAFFILGSLRAELAEAIPAVIARIILNYGARRFSVTITEVAESQETPRDTLWGHTCQSILCWRPPQGNISEYIYFYIYIAVL